MVCSPIACLQSASPLSNRNIRACWLLADSDLEFLTRFVTLNASTEKRDSFNAYAEEKLLHKLKPPQTSQRMLPVLTEMPHSLGRPQPPLRPPLEFWPKASSMESWPVCWRSKRGEGTVKRQKYSSDRGGEWHLL